MPSDDARKGVQVIETELDKLRTRCPSCKAPASWKTYLIMDPYTGVLERHYFCKQHHLVARQKGLFENPAN